MPGGALSLLFDLPSLRFALALDVAGLPPDLRPILEARWPARSPDAGGEAEICGALAFEAVPGPVGLPPAELVTAEVTWTGPAQAEVITNAAALSLDLSGDRVAGRGRVDARRARGAIEAAIRAAAVLALARRGVLVLHASAVHRAGDGLVFLGASTAGKTTTARRLGREGLRRLADDMIAIDLASSPPTLHRLPFERAGRALADLAAGVPEGPIACLGGALVRKGAGAAAMAPLDDAPRVWAEAVITLPPAPGDALLLLERFARLCDVPLRALDAPPAGPLAPTVLPWIESLRGRGSGKKVDALPPGAQATRPGSPGGTMTETETETERDQKVIRVTRAPNVAWRVLDGAAVLVAPSSPTVQTLNPVGTLVWTLADGRTVPELVDAVVNEFEVERTEASLDVERFVLDLAAKGMLIASGAPGSARIGG